jgi:putative acetyltransferase
VLAAFTLPRGRVLNIQIRNERQGDVEQIHRVTELAFRDVPHTDHTEQFIVQALRRSRMLTVSLVAESNDEVIGHVALSPVTVSDDSASWYGMGPVSVLPEYQGKGVGSKLVNSALTELKAKGAGGCVVLGDPNYYHRFGFKVVEGLAFPGVSSEYFQALSFGDSFPQGEVAYHEAFSARG